MKGRGFLSQKGAVIKGNTKNLYYIFIIALVLQALA
jgi:hypothetical protein